MSFNQYLEEISTAISKCSDEKLDLFCFDVVSRILPFVDAVDVSDMYESEIKLLNALKHEVKTYPVNWASIGKCLDSFDEISEQDEIHAQDMDGAIVGFLSALGNWRIFCETGNKDAVYWVSQQLMNILDFNFVGTVSLDNWLTVPEIKHEFNKQIMFLRGNT
jgi:hypothetical protein